MIDKNKIIKMLAILVGIVLLASALSKIHQQNSTSLQDYAQENPDVAYLKKNEASASDSDARDSISYSDVSVGNISGNDGHDISSGNNMTTDVIAKQEIISDSTMTDISQNSATQGYVSALTGALLNGNQVIDARITYADAFYYEPLSDNLRRYITGISYPSFSTEDASEGDGETPAITYDDLCYMHILHIDFEGREAEGELICNKAIAQDLVEIFYELYYNEYQLEKVLLIDEYDGDDNASMEDNNTSCFNYRGVANSASLSKHALGLAIDINPLYNPYITYEKNGTENIAPVSASAYADRNKSFPYKIDENDLCYKLFTERGFTWGGNWNSCKDYQHFQKVVIE